MTSTSVNARGGLLVRTEANRKSTPTRRPNGNEDCEDGKPGAARVRRPELVGELAREVTRITEVGARVAGEVILELEADPGGAAGAGTPTAGELAIELRRSRKHSVDGLEKSASRHDARRGPCDRGG